MRERVLGTREVFSGKILSLRVDDVEAADGHRSAREVVSTKGAAAILCVHDGEIVLVRQYRHATREILLEIPAGIVDDGEDPKRTAERELVEEVGLRPRTLEHLATYYAAAGFTDHVVDLFYTDDVAPAPQQLEEGEVIEIERRRIEEIDRLLTSGEVKDAKTLVALGLLARRL